MATPAQAQGLCIELPGDILNCTDGSGGTEVGAITGDIIASLDENLALTDTLSLGTVGSGNILVDTLGGTTITSEDGPGLVLDSAQAITANISNITTAGDGALGAGLTAVDSIIFTADGLVETVGDLADGVVIEGSTVDAVLGSVTTEGDDSDAVVIDAIEGTANLVIENVATGGDDSDAISILADGPVSADVGSLVTVGEDSDGIELVSTDGSVLLDADAIDVDGGLSSGTIVRSADDIVVDVTLLRTGGTEGIALDLATDPALCVLVGDNSCDITATSDQITTEGFGGIGVLGRAVGDTNIGVGILRTEGDEAAGLDLGVSDLDACVVLGIGGCDTNVTIEELTTAGDNSPAALIRAAGDITADFGVLRTEGDEAAGLDLASEPDACIVLGAGACDTSFSVGELTTEGVGSTGILAVLSGDTTGDVGVLRTQGDDAVGIDLAADPTVCALIGAGGCDVNLTGGEVTTGGDGAAAVLIDAVGNVVTDLGLVSTDGDNATGLGISLDPAVCLVLGPGACAIDASVDQVDTDGDNAPGVDIDGGEDPIDVDTGDVDTDGDDSPGVDVDGDGPIDVGTGDVDTDGDNSPGIVIVGDDDPITVEFEDITTEGDDSPGVDVTGEGPIDIDGGTVITEGDDSDGVTVDGGDGPVTVDVDDIETDGVDSDGIDVVTEDGDITIIAGPVSVTGPSSDGISGVANGCGAVDITARDDITSEEGTAIVATSECTVTVTTLPGATVTGADAGIDVSSGTGATINIGDEVSATDGIAIVAEGAATVINVAETGSIVGRVNLTPEDDTINNEGLFEAIGASDFEAGDDVFNNMGTVTANGTPVFGALETFNNMGSISMVDGAANDSLTISGSYVGSGDATLGVDVVGTNADRLIVGGSTSGTTGILLNVVGTPVASPGILIVDAGSTSAGAFELEGETRRGFIDYSLRADGGDTLLVAAPGALAVEPGLMPHIGQVFWYKSADAFTQSAAHRRGRIGEEPGSHVWMQAYGGNQETGGTESLEIFGTATDFDLEYEYEYKGVQAGMDIGSRSTVFGITGGYQLGDSEFGSGAESQIAGYNIGAYLLHAPEDSGLYAQLLGKADFFDFNLKNGIRIDGGDVDGKSYGVEGEVGYRMGSSSVNIDVGGGLAWVRTEIDGFSAMGSRFDFGKASSLRGRTGVRIASAATSMAPYLDAKLLHEFDGDNDAVFESGTTVVPLADWGRGTWGRVEIGLAGNGSRAGGFIAGWGEFGDVKGYGVRAGIRF